MHLFNFKKLDSNKVATKMVEAYRSRVLRIRIIKDSLSLMDYYIQSKITHKYSGYKRAK